MVRGWPRAIDMNVSKLETIEHIREFLAGTAEVAFSHPSDESARRSFVATVLKRYGYFRLHRGPRGVLFEPVPFQRTPRNVKSIVHGA